MYWPASNTASNTASFHSSFHSSVGEPDTLGCDSSKMFATTNKSVAQMWRRDYARASPASFIFFGEISTCFTLSERRQYGDKRSRFLSPYQSFVQHTRLCRSTQGALRFRLPCKRLYVVTQNARSGISLHLRQVPDFSIASLAALWLGVFAA